MKLKGFFFVLALSFLTPFVYAQEVVSEDKTELVTVTELDSSDVEFLIQEVIKSLDNTGDFEFNFPKKLDPLNSGSRNTWLVWILGIFWPLISKAVNMGWIPKSKEGLIRQAAAVGIVSVFMIISLIQQEVSWATIISTVFSFVIGHVTYNGFWKGLGVKGKYNVVQ